MNIVQMGDSERARRHKFGTKRFTCEICGCVWEANKDEYKYQYDQRENIAWYSCRCPFCQVLVQEESKQ